MNTIRIAFTLVCFAIFAGIIAWAWWKERWKERWKEQREALQPAQRQTRQTAPEKRMHRAA